MLTCSKCKVSKDESQFNFRNKAKGTYSSQCKLCKYAHQCNYSTCQCGKKMRSTSKLCQECRAIQLTIESGYESATIGDKTYDRHKYAKYALIRYYARKIAIEAGFKCCIKCGYDKHFEVCHIKAISSFPSNTLLTTVNDISNLVPLCPTHHWEFDNGLLVF